jgi:hypothetical protein
MGKQKVDELQTSSFSFEVLLFGRGRGLEVKVQDFKCLLGVSKQT